MTATGSNSHNQLILTVLLILGLTAYTSDSARLTKRQLYHKGHIAIAPIPHGIPHGIAPVPVHGIAIAPLKPKPSEHQQDLSKVPGTPGVDYPLFHEVPPTGFACDHVPHAPGIYANVETGCQAYHVCHDGREGHQGAAFLCPNGTLFNQHEFACDWWYNVNCADAPRLYNLNLDPIKNPYSPKPKKEEPEAPAPAPYDPYHPQYYPQH
ncbi:uncharacterized protein LOC142327825 [Lycorma delicatula]|uniref:uncharacterized protein LOC142327825 n=1 Tax=Lycorma delicatula TaxID=130591 RepID=UPI003F5148CC